MDAVPRVLALFAYRLADAMLAERERASTRKAGQQ